MSLDFYDSTGRPYAYSEDGESIFTFDGKPVAYINGESVFSYTGTHIGSFINGLIRCPNGSISLFSNDSSGGPVKPKKQKKPIKGIKQTKPIKGLKVIKPTESIDGLGWYQYAPESLFEV